MTTQNKGKNKCDQEDLKGLDKMFSKLNPTAKAFIPSLRPCSSSSATGIISNATATPSSRNEINKKHKDNGNGKRLLKTGNTDAVKRTVYIDNLYDLATELEIADLFKNCGQVLDCRLCSDPKSDFRYAFIEYTDVEGAKKELTRSGTMVGSYPIYVLPSQTAIAPVNQDFLPQSYDERERCARTIHCTNIHKKVTARDLSSLFESYGEVSRTRMINDRKHAGLRIAFVEFALADSATKALSCGGTVFGSSTIRVMPSKTTIRPRSAKHTRC